MSCPLLPVCNVGQTVGWTKKKLGVQVGLGPGHTVLVEDPAPPSTKGHSPRFSAHICCGQIAEWIKMLLGMEPGLGPSSFVLDGDRAPPSQKGRSPQIFGPCLAGWIKMVLGMEISLSPSEFVLDGDPSTSPKRGRSSLPIFGPFLFWSNGWMHQDSRPQPRGLCVKPWFHVKIKLF